MTKKFQFMKINIFNINPDHVTTFLLILSICATPMRSAMVTLNLVIHFSPMLFEFKQLIKYYFVNHSYVEILFILKKATCFFNRILL